jgi:hypothetical protein
MMPAGCQLQVWLKILSSMPASNTSAAVCKEGVAYWHVQ